MKTIISLVSLLIFTSAFAQNGDELMVYSLKGNVTVLENNKESKLKIGKMLKRGATIKTQKDAKLTLVCKEGKPISVIREGSFPVDLWKDSCEGSHTSVTSKYFQYIWDQLYVRSDEYKREHPDGSGSTMGAPVRGQDEAEIWFHEMMDTIRYGAGVFSLSWTTSFDYPDKFYFRLENSKGGKPVYEDSVPGNSISLQKLKKYMRPGNNYTWSVATKKTGVYKGGIIQYFPAKTITQYIAKLQKMVTVPEDTAARYFRLAYQLEDDRYPADAFTYYQKAATADPSSELYKEKLDEFKILYLLN